MTRFQNTYKFYRSKAWETFREQMRLSRLNENHDLLCERCGKVLINPYDAICHHVNELTDTNVNDFTISLNPENIEVICHKCHNEIHHRYGTFTKHVYLVYGPPCSGKSTYVKKSARKDDLIIDVDELYRAISKNNLHENESRLTSTVLQLRDLLVDMVSCKNGDWINAWFIYSKCNPSQIERYVKMLDAEPIHIKCSKEICLERAYERGDNSVNYVEAYFKDYEKYKDLMDHI